MILVDRDIHKLIEDGCIRNADPNLVRPASLDLRLSNEFLVEDEPSGFGIVSLTRGGPSFRVLRTTILLRPGQFCLASTAEIFHLPDDVVAFVKMRSSAARLGLDHALAGFCDPGWNGSRLTFELKNNLEHHNIQLSEGDSIAQMIFVRLNRRPMRSYGAIGRYNGDLTTQPMKVNVK